ncbi:MAG: signal peptidase I [Candidatus Hadarchaeaceae archaeon]
MVGPRKKRKLRRAILSLKNFLRRPTVHGTVEFLLMLGILYFAFTGVMILILRTDSYWRGVTSQSMRHEDDFSWRQYYVDRGIDPSQFPIQGGFERGDLLFVQGVSSFSEIKVGDVVILDQGRGVIPLVHRVVQIWYENGLPRFMTKGDANSLPLPSEEVNRPEQILGKVIFVIPKLGYISLWFQGQ